jgi:hypothetical protein
MGDPVTTTTLAMSAGSKLLEGAGARAEAKSQQKAAQVNAFIGRTRAIQTDTSARDGLNSELATMRATFAANGQRPNVGTMAMFDELRKVRGRERRIEMGNRQQEAASYRTEAANYGRKGDAAMLAAAGRAAPSIFSIYDLSRKS